MLMSCTMRHADPVDLPPSVDPEPPPEASEDEARLYWEDAAGELAIVDALDGRPLSEATEGGWTALVPPAAGADPGASTYFTAGGGAGAASEHTYEFDDVDIEGELGASAEIGGLIGTKGSSAGYGGLGSRGSGLGGGGVGYGAAPVGRELAGFKAGSTDDNADFEAYLDFLDGWSLKDDVAPDGYDWVEVAGRRFIRVVDAHGNPLPGARVSVVDRDADRLVWTGRTYGDGRVPFYPESTPEGGWLVQGQYGDSWQTQVWDGGGDEVSVALDLEAADAPVQLDVGFVIDTTGSMGDEIDRIKATLLRLTEQLGELPQDFELRYGAVLYRDVSDSYVTRTYDFTSDLRAFDDALQGIQASGGGDKAESLNQGLARAVDGLSWGEDGPRLLFLIADAEPHMDYQDDVPYALSMRAAVHRGIRVHTVAASGLGATGSLVFRQIAQYTRGQFVFIEYGSLAESAASHGVTGQPASNNLDAILYERIRAELEGWGLSSGYAEGLETP